MIFHFNLQFVCIVSCLFPIHYDAFTVRTTTTTPLRLPSIQQQQQQQQQQQKQSSFIRYHGTKSLPYHSTQLMSMIKDKSLIVISPPGGVGEVCAVKAATMGASVKWFVVSPPPLSDMTTTTTTTVGNKSSPQVVLSQHTLIEINNAGGNIDLAGSDSTSLLLPDDDPNSAIQAVSTWCNSATSMICTYDGIIDYYNTKNNKKNSKINNKDDIDGQNLWKNAMKITAQEASKVVSGNKVAILSAEEAMISSSNNDVNKQEEEIKGGITSFVNNLFGGNKVNIPSTLVEAMSSCSSITEENLLIIRYGKLFGIPESSPNFSPLIGGPKKDYELCEEYLMRSVRIDSTLSVSGNIMLSGTTTRSSRHAVGEAAALMALELVQTQPNLDVCLSSQLGSNPITLSMWQDEFSRVIELLSTGRGGAELFKAEFASIPDISRLVDWLAQKWAPTVLRTYDIASIRVGARPVYVTQPKFNTIEIIWQQLVNFESIIVGTMIIEINENDNTLVAIRGPGNIEKGFGSVSTIPLAGEDVLVRRLSEAASQAVEKGLANKKVDVQAAAAAAETPKKVIPKVEPVVATSLQSSGTIVEEETTATTTKTITPTKVTGPRQAGVRRSKERSRGKQRKTSTSNDTE